MTHMEEQQLADRRTDTITTAMQASAWTDRTGVSWIEMKGQDRIDLLHRLSTNDMTKLLPGKGMQTVLLTEKARIIDVVTVLHDADRSYLLGSPGTSSTVVAWLRKYVIMDDVRMVDRSNDVTAIEVLGPHAADHIQQLTGVDVGTWTIGQWARTDTDPHAPFIVRMPSPAELSFWIIGSHEGIAPLRSTLVENADAIPHLQSSEVEYLRIRAGLGKLGNEWGEAYNPLEAGLLHLTSFTKGCYIGQEVVARLDSYNKVKQRVMGVIAPQDVHVGDAVVTPDGASIGVVTSTTRTRDAAQTLALAYVRGEHAHPDTPIIIRTPSGDVVATQVLPPISDASCP